MNIKGLAIVGTSTMATVILGVLICGQGNLQAVDEQSATKEITSPTLAVSGCNITLHSPGALKLSEKPTITLVAENPTATSVDVPVTISMMGMPKMESTLVVSRAGPADKQIWTHTLTLTIPPGKTTTQYQSDIAISDVENVRFRLASGQSQVLTTRVVIPQTEATSQPAQTQLTMAQTK